MHYGNMWVGYVRCVVFLGQFAVCYVQCEVCSVHWQYAVCQFTIYITCSMQYAVCSVKDVVSIVQCAVGKPFSYYYK